MPQNKHVPLAVWLSAAGIALAAALAPNAALAANPVHLLTKATWRQTIAHVSLPGAGCFAASYPTIRWHATRCKTAPEVPFEPAPSKPPTSVGPHAPMTVGNGSDYSAAVSGLISEAIGSFSNVSSGITEKGQYGGTGPQTANTFSLQLNTQTFTTPACATSSNPANCHGWEQFIYSTHANAVFMQYWLLGYGSTCPSQWSSYKGSCWINSPAATLSDSALTAAELGKVSLWANASAGGNDQATMFGPSDTDITAVANTDSMLDLAADWNTAEFAVVGDAGGGQADFGSGTTLEAQTQVVSNSPYAPTCVREGFTGETNNLNLVSTPALTDGGQPTIASEQSNATSTPPSCASAGTVVGKISSLYDPATGQLHVFSVTAAGVYETYWSDSNNRKTTGLINTLQNVSGISSFYDPNAGVLHVFSITPSGVYETYWSDSGGRKTTGPINTLHKVSAISSFFDASAGQAHVFAVTPSGVEETYWPNSSGGKTTGLINNLTNVSAISSFFDASAGQAHVFAVTPSGVEETYWPDSSGGKTTGPINTLHNVSAISSFFDASAAQAHVFAVTPSGVEETYWPDSSGGKTTGLINNLTNVSAISSFLDASAGQAHVFAVTPSGVEETYWPNSSGGKTTGPINNLPGLRTAISSFFDTGTGQAHVFTFSPVAPAGEYETYWPNSVGGKTTDLINRL